jgi:shikimate 5-dehydrogenase
MIQHSQSQTATNWCTDNLGLADTLKAVAVPVFLNKETINKNVKITVNMSIK